MRASPPSSTVPPGQSAHFGTDSGSGALRLQFALFVLAALAALWGFTLFALDRREQLDLASAEVEMRALAQAYAENALSTIKRIDLILLELSRTWTTHPEAFGAEIARLRQNLDDVAIQVATIDRGGRMVYSTLPLPAAAVDLSDREYFIVQQQASSNRLFISKPVLGRVSGLWSLQFTRPLLRDGHFDGVILISVAPELFSRFHDTLAMGRQGVTLMVRDSGEIMARAPEWRPYMGRSLPTAPYLAPGAPAQGNFKRVAVLDAVPRLYGYRKLPEYQLNFVAALPLDEILAGTARQRQAAITTMTAVSLALVAMGWLILRSVRARDRAELALRDANRELSLAASVFRHTMDAVIVTEIDGTIVSVNPAFTAVTGYTAAEVVGRTPRLLQSGRHEPAFYRAMFEQLERTGHWRGEIWNRRKNGESYLEWISISLVRDELGKPLRYVGVSNDVTELRAGDERMRHLAFHDPLTGLPNRALLLDRMTQGINVAERDGRGLGVMFIDLDRFKSINDTLGHDVGDQLLQQVAQRLSHAVRHSDTVARIGGDEFVILLEQVDDGITYVNLADKLLSSLSRPMVLGAHTLEVGASIGIACYPGDGDSAAILMKHADAAMYVAKAGGRGAYQFYRPGMTAQAVQRTLPPP
ncbi:bifunctional diguanylate cyclase/phosphodiesterase [Rugamonas apoptosis]|nr:diguanylate cyclase [Rugamonas apoptosis]